MSNYRKTLEEFCATAESYRDGSLSPKLAAAIREALADLTEPRIEHCACCAEGKAEVVRLRAALDDIRNHVCLRTEPSAVSMRQIAEAALTGE